MPLSDHEQRLLEQMERALYAEDPKFADSLRKNRRPSVNRKTLVLGIAGALAELAVLVAGVATSVPLVGLLGFLGTVAGAFVAYRAYTTATPADEAATAAPAGPAPRGASTGDSGFMDKLEDRWRKRRDERDQF